ncbi:MFS transporter [Kribbella sp.]|uniref:MFS transporter n=1 Tax=Kribbella sp. TaxID=1871183 RepID=UPI002D5E601F|nr:MFS transporter [Kribbella sp.]HZX04912.1 MFS transporter [Kribbella sp.]
MPGTGAVRVPRSISGSAAVLMFLLILIAYSVNAMDRMVFPVLLGEVRAEYGFGLAAAGLQSTLFALGMGITGVPAGIALRRVSRKNVLVLGTLVFSVATMLTVASFGFWDMVAWRVLSGVGEALQLVAILTVSSHAFPRHRGIAIGSVNVAFGTGSLVGPNLGVALHRSFDSWRAPMIAFGLIGIVAALLVLIAVRPAFTERTSVPATEREAVHHLGGATSFRSHNPLVLAAITVLFGLIDFGYIGMYASFTIDHLGFTQEQAAFVVGLSGIAAFASPLGGWLVDRLTPRIAIGALSIAQAVCGTALFAGPADVGWQATWSFLFGLVASSGVYVGLASSLVKSMAEAHSSRASGLFTSCIYVAAGFAGLVFSLVVGVAGWSAAGLIQITGLSVLSCLLALTLRDAQFSRLAPVNHTEE